MKTHNISTIKYEYNSPLCFLSTSHSQWNIVSNHWWDKLLVPPIKDHQTENSSTIFLEVYVPQKCFFPKLSRWKTVWFFGSERVLSSWHPQHLPLPSSALANVWFMCQINAIEHGLSDQCMNISTAQKCGEYKALIWNSLPSLRHHWSEHIYLRHTHSHSESRACTNHSHITDEKCAKSILCGMLEDEWIFPHHLVTFYTV